MIKNLKPLKSTCKILITLCGFIIIMLTQTAHSDPPQTPKPWRPRLRSITETFFNKNTIGSKLLLANNPNGAITILNTGDKQTCQDECKFIIKTKSNKICEFVAKDNNVKIKSFAINKNTYQSGYTFKITEHDYVTVVFTYLIQNETEIEILSIDDCAFFTGSYDELSKGTMN